MSINIGNFNYENINNKLIINSYINSNVINLNTDITSHKDTVINYKNKFYTGIKNNNYIIEDDNNNKLYELTSNSTTIRTDLILTCNLNIKDLFKIYNDNTTITSNLVVNLKKNNKILFNNENNTNLVYIDNSNYNLSLANKNIYTINSNIYLNTDTYIKSTNTLYTNEIRSPDNTIIKIYNPIIEGLRIISCIYSNHLSIINDINYNNPSITIKRFYNDTNIIDIYSSNQQLNTPEMRAFSVSNKGYIGIGSNLANAAIYVSTPETSNIFYYDGNNIGDRFIIKKNGNVGIGTSIPTSLLDINRMDDLTNNELRKNPLVSLKINYEPINNYATSNIITTVFENYNYLDYIYNNEDKLIDTIPKTKNNYTLIPETNISLIINTKNINHNILINNTDNLSTLINKNYIFPSESLNIDNNFLFYINNKIYYPNIFWLEQRIDTSYITYTLNNKIHYLYNYGFNIMSENTFNNGRYETNSAKFNYIDTSNIVYDQDNIVILIVQKIYVETGSYPYSYNDIITPRLQPAPSLLYASSNNYFMAELSSQGCLSLGSRQTSNNYMIYTKGTSYLNNIECYKLSSIEGKKNINFSDCNISNVNKIFSTSNICNNIICDYAKIDNMLVNNIKINTQTVDSINIANFSFNSINANNFKMDYRYANINVPLLLGSNITTTDNYYSKICVNNNIPKGLLITNDVNNINPLLTLEGKNNYAYPIINLKSSLTNFQIAITSNNYNSEYTESFQIYNISKNTNLINYNNNFNIASLGNNNILINLNTPLNNIATNESNKISIGYPYRYLIQNNNIPNNWPIYFKDNLLNSQYMLNVYGNINFSSINNKPIIRGVVNDTNLANEKVYVGIGNEPDNLHTLYVDGEALIKNSLKTTSNLYVSMDCYVYNNIYSSGTIGSISDINIKTDIKKIQNVLDKLDEINGYTYTRKDTGNIETGLIAQEVEKILPEVIIRNKEHLHISYGNMNGYIIECLKELKAKIINIENHLFKNE